MKKVEHLIKEVYPGSIAEELEIEPGDVLLSINDQSIEDVFDYRYMIKDEYIEVLIRKPDGEEWVLEIDKDYDDDLGIEFENQLMSDYKSCSNKCIFCFIDQMPPNMRETLYFKDDDSRLSFLQGNFITMTNMGDKEIDKRIKYRISPVNVSVHTTNPILRAKMLGNRFAGDVLDKMKRLKSADITMNAQIVLVPDVNDKEELDKTINDLACLYPQLNSVAIVPIGITKYRENLCKVEIFDKESANEVINQIEKIQNELLDKLGTRFAFLSDEFYVMANRNLPTKEAYEGYVQLENGVGLISKLEHEIYEELEKTPKYPMNRHISIATGKSAFEFINSMAKLIMKEFEGLKIDVHMISNEFFGETITVAGLITASDIEKQLKDKNLGEELIIPRSMMKADEDIFLDNITLDELKQRLKIEIIISEVEGRDFIDKLLGRA